MSAKLAIVIGGISFATMTILLLAAYHPNFMPTAYINLRKSGLIMAVPMICAIGFMGAIGWLWFECKERQKGDGHDIK